MKALLFALFASILLFGCVHQPQASGSAGVNASNESNYSNASGELGGVGTPFPGTVYDNGTLDANATPGSGQLNPPQGNMGLSTSGVVNQWVGANGVELIVHSFEFREESNGATPSSGYKFLLVDVTIKNNGPSLQPYARIAVPSNVDQVGDECFDRSNRLPDAFSEDEIVTGGERRGIVECLVPVNVRSVSFDFDTTSVGTTNPEDVLSVELT